jgi:TetR/AcrR family hemagglutinin/protease transcriptional regulator
MKAPEKEKLRLPKEQRHAQLLMLAIAVAAKKGLGQIVHADLAEEAGIVTPTVFRYFPTRQALVRSIVAEVGQYYRDQSDYFHTEPKDPRQAINNHLTAFAESIDTRYDYAAVWLQWGASVQNDCGIWDMFKEHNAHLIQSVSRTIRQAHQEQHKDIKRSEIRAQNLIGVAFAITMLKLSDASDDAITQLIALSLEDVFS